MTSISFLLASCTGGSGPERFSQGSNAGLDPGQWRDLNESATDGDWRDAGYNLVFAINQYTDSDLEFRKMSDDNKHMVVYDKTNDSYTAISLEGYDLEYKYADGLNNSVYTRVANPSSAADLFETRSASDSHFYHLDPFAVDNQGSVTTYYRHESGLEFDKTTGTPKDLAKLVSLEEKILLEKNTEALLSLGLSVKRASELAELGMRFKKIDKNSLTTSEQDMFLMEAYGFNTNDLRENYEQDSLEVLVKKAALRNGVDPEAALNIFSQTYFH